MKRDVLKKCIAAVVAIGYLIPNLSSAAIVNIISWELNSDDEAQTTTGSADSIQTTVVRSGTYAYRVNSSGTGFGQFEFRKPDTNGANVNWGASDMCITGYFRANTLPTTSMENFFRILGSDSKTRIEGYVAADGKIGFYWQGGTLIATSTGSINTGEWTKISIGAGTGNSGDYYLYINDVLDMSGTFNFGSLTNFVERINIGEINSNTTQTIDFYYDDWVFEDVACTSATRPSAKIVRLFPNANGTYTGWTAGTGSSNYLEVDEVIPDSTTYVQSPSAGSVSTFNLQDTSTAGLSNVDIIAVKPFIHVAEVGADASLQLRTRVNSTDYDLGTYVVPSGRNNLFAMYETSPNTGVSWTTSEIDGMEVGAEEIVGSTNRGRMYIASAMVAYVPAAAPQPGSYFKLMNKRLKIVHGKIVIQ